MREIKFRQYNKENRQWHYCGYIDGQWVNPLQQDCYQLPEQSQQVTIYKDKEGREIADGDIIKNIIFNDGSKHDIPVEVVFEKSVFKVVGIGYLHDIKECQLVGSIYENPDYMDWFYNNPFG